MANLSVRRDLTRLRFLAMLCSSAVKLSPLKMEFMARVIEADIEDNVIDRMEEVYAQFRSLNLTE